MVARPRATRGLVAAIKDKGGRCLAKEVRDFITRPELFSLLMWLPSPVVSSPFSRSSVGQRTFSPAAFQRAPRASAASNFSMRRPFPRRSIDPTAGCRDLFYVSEANGPASPFPQFARKTSWRGWRKSAPSVSRPRAMILTPASRSFVFSRAYLRIIYYIISLEYICPTCRRRAR